MCWGQSSWRASLHVNNLLGRWWICGASPHMRVAVVYWGVMMARELIKSLAYLLLASVKCHRAEMRWCCFGITQGDHLNGLSRWNVSLHWPAGSVSTGSQQSAAVMKCQQSLINTSCETSAMITVHSTVKVWKVLVLLLLAAASRDSSSPEGVSMPEGNRILTNLWPCVNKKLLPEYTIPGLE